MTMSAKLSEMTSKKIIKNVLLASYLLSFSVLALPSRAEANEQAIRTWAFQTIRSINGLTKENYEEKKETGRQYFTEEGHASFHKFMESKGTRLKLESGMTSKARAICITEVTPPSAKGKTWTLKAQMAHDWEIDSEITTDKEKLILTIAEINNNSTETFAIVNYLAVPAVDSSFTCGVGTQVRHLDTLIETHKQLDQELQKTAP